MATWGAECGGGNSTALREQLVDVVELVPSELSVAARMGGDGSALRGVDRKVAVSQRQCVAS